MKRYDFDRVYGTKLEESKDGGWIRFEDAERILWEVADLKRERDRLREEMESDGKSIQFAMVEFRACKAELDLIRENFTKLQTAWEALKVESTRGGW